MAVATSASVALVSSECGSLVAAARNRRSCNLRATCESLAPIIRNSDVGNSSDPPILKGSERVDAEMTTRGNHLGRDAAGGAVLWSSAGQQVMMEWEEAYMERCVAALGVGSGDRVLEIGFGLAYSAASIQRRRPKLHTIIECDEEVLVRADAFAARHPSVRVVRGTWQRELPSLGEFDCIFFDDFPLPELVETSANATATAATLPLCPGRSRWHSFLDVALQHTALGSRITGYLARPLALARPGCKYSVQRVHVDVAADCNYFPYWTALVPLLTVEDTATARGGGEPAGSVSQTPIDRSHSRRCRRFHKHLERAMRERALDDEIVIVGCADDEPIVLDSDELSEHYEMETVDDKVANEPLDQERSTKTESPHYADATSRREFLASLRRAKSRQAAQMARSTE